MPPRRSSRARPAQPANNHSSSSSTTSGRAERHTRSHTKASSPRKVTPRSHTSDELVDQQTGNKSDQPQTRRQKRPAEEKDADLSRTASQSVDAGALEEEEEDEEEEEEVTRCVCGQLEYPGPPSPASAAPRSRSKEENTSHSPSEVVEAPLDELGSLFIQCDTCKVWQHGGCVGIMEVSMSPDEYFCEECRRDLHKIFSGSKGPRSSRYIPVVGPGSRKPSRSGSLSKDSDSKNSKAKSGAQSGNTPGSKRRSTMNSRDAAYDEEEQLRRAIEESKAEKKAGNSGNSVTKGKRERSESEEMKQGPAKRQRTTSESASSANHLNNQGIESDGEHRPGKASTRAAPKRARGAAARRGKNKELPDPAAEKDKQKEEVVGRRKGRAERRRVEESEPDDDGTQSRSTTAKAPAESNTQSRQSPTTSKAEKDTTAPQGQPSSTAGTQRKTGRPQARRGRVGRNQYTKDRDLGRDITGGNGRREPSTARSQSRDVPTRDETAKNGTASASSNSHPTNTNHESSSGKPSRPRYMNPQRTTMNEMKRRVAAILEFISRIQVEMACEKTPPSSENNSITTTSATTAAAVAMIKAVAGEVLPKITLTGEEGGQAQQPAEQAGGNDNNTNNGNKTTKPNNNSSASGAEEVSEKDFSQLTSLEMMDVLTRKLVLWQKEYGKWGDR